MAGADLDELVDAWLTLPEVAERLGVDITKVRTLLKEHRLVAARRGERSVLSVPERLVPGPAPLKGLAGTLTMLDDFGYTPEEAIGWLFALEPALGMTPVDALHDNRPTAVHRAAQLRAL